MVFALTRNLRFHGISKESMQAPSGPRWVGPARTWRGALLPDTVEVRIEVLEAAKRPVNAAADNVEFKSVVEVIVATEKRAHSMILFDPDHSWDERILKEQFRY